MKFDRETIDVIIPTYDNVEQLVQAVSSMNQTSHSWPMSFIIVNNGKAPLEKYLPESDNLKILNPGENLGWTGGLKYGLEHSDSKYVLFANDDIFIPTSSFLWLTQMVRHLIIWPKIAAVGPSSNVVMGQQNIWNGPNCFATCVPFLIGFCVLVRRSTLDEVGGIDEDFATGDDIELSIRFLDAGYQLMLDKTVFVYHHGFQTGTKIHGDHTKPGGWNSSKMTEDTNRHIIQKHGFMKFYWTMARGLDGWWPDVDKVNEDMRAGKDVETEKVLESLEKYNPDDVVEIGCGGKKTVPDSLGVDQAVFGEAIPYTGRDCVADVTADAEKPLYPILKKKFKYVIARHVLEHCVDVVGAIESWKGILEEEGKLIISVPDERIANTILLNPEHVHAFTPEALTKILHVAGLEVTKLSEYYSCDSFTVECQRRVV